MTLPRQRSLAILEARGIEKSLGEGEARVSVLRGLDLTLQPATTYAIVGPSGCGKSTLLYLLGMLDYPDGGEIHFNGQDMAKASDDQRTATRNHHLGFVFQFHFLLPEFTVMENVMMPMRKRGRLTQEAMEDRAIELLRGVGLGDKTRRLASQLSGGEQQRVAIARSLANNPLLLLADEPTGNLDMRNSAMVFELLQRVASENGQSILIVTHNLDLAGRCESVLRMRDGCFES